MFLNGVKINEWVDDPNIDLARIGIAQRAVGTPLNEDESVGDARYMHGADGRNRYNGWGRDQGKGVGYISSERVGVRLIGAGVMGAGVMAAREVLSLQAGSEHHPLPRFRARSVKRQRRELERMMVSGVASADLRCAGRRKGCSDRG